MNTDDMYQEEILDHYRHPHNRGRIAHADIHAHDSNPLCGDVIDIYIKLTEDRKIHEITFEGHGCAISQAAASMLTDHLKGKPLQAIMDLKKEDILGLLKIELSAMRIKCALLAMKTAKVGAVSYLSR